MTSEIPGFYRLPMAERRGRVARMVRLDEEELRVVAGDGGLCGEQADLMVENALGVLGLPLGLCVNLRVDDRDRLAPMAIEECSVVAAASHAAKLLRAGGGVHTDVGEPRMIGQIQLSGVPDPPTAEEAVRAASAQLIAEVLADSAGESSSLREMCSYHMATGGKRLRAILPLFVADALGVDPDRLVPFGAACEMLHNATLVHDDLQDGDSMRRGKATVWRRFGREQAINLGDAMFYYAVLLAQRLPVAACQREATVHRLVCETLKVINGQERELELRRAKRPTLADYFAMVEQKTSGLFALPMAGAAVLCGQPGELVAGLEQAARQMGVLFQIQDDVLDLYGEKGRGTRGSDIREGKRSLLVVHARQHASRAEARWLTAVLDKERGANTREEIARATALLMSTGSLSFALQEMQRRRDLALAGRALRSHQTLLAVVEAMCGLFLEPIASVLSVAGMDAFPRLVPAEQTM